MAIQANETHVYKTRTLARGAVTDAGLDLDDVHVCRAGDPPAWGWIPLVEWEAEIGVHVAQDTFGNEVIASGDATAEPVKYAPANIGFMLDSGDDLPSVASDGAAEFGSEYEPEPTAQDELPLAEPPALVVADAPADAVDPTAGLLICDMETPDFADCGDVFLRLGPYMPYAAKAEAMALAKRLQIDVEIVADSGAVVLRVGPKGKATAKGKPETARRVPFGAGDGMTEPQRPPINSAGHKSVEKILDRIEDASADLDLLLSMVGTFSTGYTYGRIAGRYLESWIKYRRAHPANDDLPGEVLQDAAD